MKFGKQILANQVPGWTAYYLDYKALKKIVSSLTKKKLATNASLSPATALDPVPFLRPGDMLRGAATANTPLQERSLVQPRLWEPSANDASLVQPPLPVILASTHDDDRGPSFQEHKAAFFQKLENELTKINTFYLQKEAELRLRLENMLRKRQAAAERLGENPQEDGALDYVEWRAVEEGFRLLERDLGKMQQFIEMNATGFRKILKKWDKRSKSTTKELYLSRQVEVMPCFNRQLIAEMTDAVASCLLDVTNIPDTAVSFGITHDSPDRTAHMTTYNELEDSFGKAIGARDEDAIRSLLARAAGLAVQAGGRMQVTRILWRAIIVAPARLADIMLASNDVPFDFGFVDDINGRTCLHEAAIAGELRLVNICLSRGVQVDRADAYARTALHYAAIKGHAGICRALLAYNGGHGIVDPTSLDLDNYSPLIYACSNGSSDCVAVFLADPRVLVNAPAAAGDLMPLSLAAQYGHTEVVRLLMNHDARSLPNTNGEYPIHLAAREGHADVCKFLVQRDACDRADKYNEWTPLFHAAENGHAGCITVLLQAGCSVAAVDENGRTPIYYAAWNGHVDCVSLLLAARRDPTPRGGNVQISPSGISPYQQDGGSEIDLDIIPSLSLPPPIMPDRSYGHTYLLKSHLVIIALGHPFTGSGGEPLRLKPRLFAQDDRHMQQTSPSLRLVISSKPDGYTAPFEVSLPVGRENGVFSFQAPSLDDLALEFSLYPSFGSRTLGKAVALPSVFATMGEVTSCLLPMLDRRLHTIGEISFDIFKISPLQGAALAVGGGVETYWRSNSLPISVPAPPMPTRSLGSAHTSPSTRSTVATETQRGPTVSSLVGDFVHVVVQLTRDCVPVLCATWILPDPHYTLGVSDVTFAQFQSLSSRLGKNMLKRGQAATASDWQGILSESLVSLSTVCESLPTSIGISLELAFSPATSRSRPALDINSFVDAVLQVLYKFTAIPQHEGIVRRKVALFSFAPDVCAAVNWKQPNYPVFFASACGVPAASLRSPLVDRATWKDRRCRSIGAAVEFARSNNLLGIMAPASLLVDVPSLADGVKDSNLMLAVFGASDVPLSSDRVDASLCEGVFTVPEHQLIGLI